MIVKKKHFADYLVAFTLILILLALNSESLPDYHSYSDMFYGAENYSFEYLAIVRFFEFFSFLNFSYDGVRYFFIFMAALVFKRFLFKVDRTHNSTFLFQLRQGAFLLFITVIVFVEFYLVRLRAGLSLTAFFLAILPFAWNGRRLLYVLCFVIFTSVSAVIHFQTAVVVGIFLLPAIFLRNTKILGKRGKYIFSFLLFFILWAFVFRQAIDASVGQRIWTTSPLNPFRFLVISPVPIIIILIQFYIAYRHFLCDSKNSEIADDCYIIFHIGYSVAAFIVAVLYFSGGLDQAGETTVRIMTLASFAALWMLMAYGFSVRNIFSIYILSSNSLFFYNTLYL